eukprot:3246127-Amphidinium_carterae.5
MNWQILQVPRGDQASHVGPCYEFPTRCFGFRVKPLLIVTTASKRQVLRQALGINKFVDLGRGSKSNFAQFCLRMPTTKTRIPHWLPLRGFGTERGNNTVHLASLLMHCARRLVIALAAFENVRCERRLVIELAAFENVPQRVAVALLQLVAANCFGRLVLEPLDFMHVSQRGARPARRYSQDVCNCQRNNLLWEFLSENMDKTREHA